MYNVINDLINLSHIEYYDSFRKFVYRMKLDEDGDVTCELNENVSVMPLNKSKILFSEYEIPIGSKIDPESDLYDTINRCYNNCKLVVPGIDEYYIFQDYGNYGHEIIGTKPLYFITGSIIPSSNFSLMSSPKGLFISYTFKESLVIIKMSNVNIGDIDPLEISAKRPFNSQFYMRDDKCIYFHIFINSKDPIIVDEDTEITFGEISTPEYLNAMMDTKWNDANRSKSEYMYIELSDILFNGFTEIHKSGESDPDFVHLIASNGEIQLDLTIDTYGDVQVYSVNLPFDFYPSDLPDWADDPSEYKDNILSEKNLKQLLNEYSNYKLNKD